MNKEKKKVLVVLGDDFIVRNFVEMEALSELEKKYDLYYITRRIVKQNVNPDKCFKVKTFSKERTYIRWRMNITSMKRYESRCKTFPLKSKELVYDYLSKWNQLKFDIASLPGIAEIYRAITELSLGTLKEVDQVVDQLKPDFMLIPSGFADSFSIDCIKTAKKKRIKHMMVMGNWDNACSKCVLTVMPDKLGVWGTQTKSQAIRIHNFSEKDIIKLGAPHFEVYFKQPKSSIIQIRNQNNIPQDKVVLMYVGTSKYVDEIGVLKTLEAAIERGALKDAHILYRPHPYRAAHNDKENFFSCDFKHVSIDFQLVDHYKRVLEDETYQQSKRKVFLADYTYYPSLFNAVDGVISPLTTMGIEAMLMGKPVLIQAFEIDGKRFSANKMIDFEQHDCWGKMSTVITCLDKDVFIDDCKKLIALAKEKSTVTAIKEEVKYVVYSDERTYAQRLSDSVNDILENREKKN